MLAVDLACSRALVHYSFPTLCSQDLLPATWKRHQLGSVDVSPNYKGRSEKRLEITCQGTERDEEQQQSSTVSQASGTLLQAIASRSPEEGQAQWQKEGTKSMNSSWRNEPTKGVVKEQPHIYENKPKAKEHHQPKRHNMCQ